MKLLALALIIVLAMGGVGYLIWQTADGADLEEIISITSPETVEESPSEPSPTLPDTSWLLDSLNRFTAVHEEQKKEPEKKSIGSISLSALYSPLSQRFAVSGSLNLFGFTLGAVYTGDVYVSLGYTFSF